MSYLKFDKSELVNLEYSLRREILSTNRNGGYLNTTIVCCNIRKYHGLLVCPIEKFGEDNHVLLSSLDETLVQREKDFNLGIHRYPGSYEPRGHKYIVEFEYEPVPTIYYRVGGMLFKKELLMSHHESQLFIRYTLLEAHSPTTLRLKPFLAFRNIHNLCKANMEANTKYKTVENGIASKLYEGFPNLYMQLNKKNEFIATPDWYYNISYIEEKKRGYDYREDLFVPGYFEVPIKKGESIIFSASLKEETKSSIDKGFDEQMAYRPVKDSYLTCLKNSALQFIIKQGNTTGIIAGYPWFGRWGRDTFISVPGLTLAAQDNPELCKTILDDSLAEFKDGFFPNTGGRRYKTAWHNSADVPLWFIWAVQQYENYTKDSAGVWKSYGKKMQEILKSYRDGVRPSIKMHANGFIWQEEEGKALTWMDAVVNGKPVTQRAGYAVEINALWYNAICFMLRLAKENGSTAFIKEWEDVPALIRDNFMATFWCDERQHLADYVGIDGQNIFTRPNQIFATSLEFSPIPEEARQKVLLSVERELLTPKGIRTLSPKNPLYKGRYEGSQTERDLAYHQGTVWPWLLGNYVEGCFKLYGKGFIEKAKEIAYGFEEDINWHGIGSISELYDGNPPRVPCGVISEACSVAEIFRIFKMIEHYEGKKYIPTTTARVGTATKAKKAETKPTAKKLNDKKVSAVEKNKKSKVKTTTVKKASTSKKRNK